MQKLRDECDFIAANLASLEPFNTPNEKTAFQQQQHIEIKHAITNEAALELRAHRRDLTYSHMLVKKAEAAQTEERAEWAHEAYNDTCNETEIMQLLAQVNIEQEQQKTKEHATLEQRRSNGEAKPWTYNRCNIEHDATRTRCLHENNRLKFVDGLFK